MSEGHEKVEEFWIGKLESARELMEEVLKEERDRSAKTLAAERSRHEETNKARLRALGDVQELAFKALTEALAEERKARSEAESRAKEQQKVVIENKMPEKTTSWRIEVVKRDANGFVLAMEATPK